MFFRAKFQTDRFHVKAPSWVNLGVIVVNPNPHSWNKLLKSHASISLSSQGRQGRVYECGACEVCGRRGKVKVK